MQAHHLQSLTRYWWISWTSHVHHIQQELLHPIAPYDSYIWQEELHYIGKKNYQLKDKTLSFKAWKLHVKNDFHIYDIQYSYGLSDRLCFISLRLPRPTNPSINRHHTSSKMLSWIRIHTCPRISLLFCASHLPLLAASQFYMIEC